MAFAGRVVNALRRTSVSSNPSLLQAVRCMSSKLFVGGMFQIWIIERTFLMPLIEIFDVILIYM